MSTATRKRLRRIDHEHNERREFEVAAKMAESCGLRLTGDARHCTLTMPATGWAVHVRLSRYDENTYCHDRNNRGPTLPVLPRGWTLADLVLAVEERWLIKKEATHG